MAVKVLVNSIAHVNSSLGVKRIYHLLRQHFSVGVEVRETRNSTNRWINRVLEQCQIGGGATPLWSPSHRGPIRARKHIVTVNDLINLTHVYSGKVSHRVYWSYLNQLFCNAEMLCPISDFTAAQIQKYFRVPQWKIRVIKPGYDVIASRVGPNTPRERFMLSVLNYLPHKNLSRLIAAVDSREILALGIRLVIVGTVSDEHRQAVAKCRVPIELQTSVGDKALRTLYTRASLYVSPSLEEGFNLTIAEALACGATVACSDIPVHRELYEGRAIFFDPIDVDSIRRAIVTGIETGHSNSAALDPCLFVGTFANDGRSFRDAAREYEQLFAEVGASG